MDSLPDDIFERLIMMQTDLRSILSLACVNKQFRNVCKNFIRKVSLPNQVFGQAACPENVHFLDKVLKKNETLCIVCRFCTAVIPVHLEAILITHQCADKTYRFVMAPNRYNVLLKLTTQQHLTQPFPCSQNLLQLRGITTPTCAPYFLK